MDSFFAYMQRLELLAFFSGYPLVYTVALLIAGSRPPGNNFKTRIASLLPFAYALVGSLYLGLQLKNLYPDYSIENMRRSIQQPWLMIWGLLSILFWIPALSKKPVLSLLHSLIFFILLLKDLFSQISAPTKDMVRNDMNVYTVSLLLNLAAIAFMVLQSFLYTRFKNRKLIK
jgi:hypothetical protein